MKDIYEYIDNMNNGQIALFLCVFILIFVLFKTYKLINDN